MVNIVDILDVVTHTLGMPVVKGVEPARILAPVPVDTELLSDVNTWKQYLHMLQTDVSHRPPRAVGPTNKKYSKRRALLLLLKRHAVEEAKTVLPQGVYLPPPTRPLPQECPSADASSSEGALLALQQIMQLDVNRQLHRVLAQLRAWSRQFPPSSVAIAVAETLELEKEHEMHNSNRSTCARCAPWRHQ